MVATKRHNDNGDVCLQRSPFLIFHSDYLPSFLLQTNLVRGRCNFLLQYSFISSVSRQFASYNNWCCFHSYQRHYPQPPYVYLLIWHICLCRACNKSCRLDANPQGQVQHRGRDIIVTNPECDPRLYDTDRHWAMFLPSCWKSA